MNTTFCEVKRGECEAVTAVYTASEGTWYGEEGEYLSHEDLLFAVIVQL